VISRVEPPRSALAVDWKNAQAVLRRDVFIPPRPVRSDYVQDDSYSAAMRRYPQIPAVKAAYRQARSYVGQVDSTGAIRFDNVPSGKYRLELKIFSGISARNPGEPQLAAEASLPVLIQPGAGDAQGPIAIGPISLQAR
jgi:hypothetical protein